MRSTHYIKQENSATVTMKCDNNMKSYVFSEIEKQVKPKQNNRPIDDNLTKPITEK